jgi:hypothetical protein
MSPAEVRELPADKLRRIVFMEARAKPRLETRRCRRSSSTPQKREHHP